MGYDHVCLWKMITEDVIGVHAKKAWRDAYRFYYDRSVGYHKDIDVICRSVILGNRPDKKGDYQISFSV